MELTVPRRRQVLCLPFDCQRMQTVWTWQDPRAATHAVDVPYRQMETTCGWDDLFDGRGPQVVHADGFLVRLCRGDCQARTDLKATVPEVRFIVSESAWFVPAASAAQLAQWRQRWLPGSVGRQRSCGSGPLNGESNSA